jgi:hypothetical protein
MKIKELNTIFSSLKEEIGWSWPLARARALKRNLMPLARWLSRRQIRKIRGK